MSSTRLALGLLIRFPLLGKFNVSGSSSLSLSYIVAVAVVERDCDSIATRDVRCLVLLGKDLRLGTASVGRKSDEESTTYSCQDVRAGCCMV